VDDEEKKETRVSPEMLLLKKPTSGCCKVCCVKCNVNLVWFASASSFGKSLKLIRSLESFIEQRNSIGKPYN